jgi:anionic cell wall polymer biosynthesis LytR-Cps2A-Psr (LCP) family protein
LDLPAGQQTVSGPTALAFVRQRHGLDGGDLDRIGRQQAFIAGLTRQLRASGALTDPARLDQLVGIVTRYVVLDRGWDVSQLVTQLRSLHLDQLTLHTIPTGRPDLQTPVDGIAVQIDRSAVREFATALMSDEARTPAAAAQSAAATPTPSANPTAAPTGSPDPSARVISAENVPCVA